MIVDIVRIGLILNAFRILEAGTDIQQRNVSQENSNVLLLHKSDMEYVSDSMLVPVKSRKYEQKRNISSLWDFLRRKLLQKKRFSSSTNKKYEKLIPEESKIKLQPDFDDPPNIWVRNFKLCSELDEKQVDNLSDGEAPTCVFACVFQKIRNKIYLNSPKGKCTRGDRVNMNNCVCNERGLGRFHVMTQIGDTIYSVSEAAFGQLVTVQQMADEVKEKIVEYRHKYDEENVVTNWLSLI